MLLASVSASAFDFEVDGCIYSTEVDNYYDLNNDEVCLREYTYDKYQLEIPARVNYDGKEYTVVCINTRAIVNKTSLTRLILPYTINHIRPGAIGNCRSLQYVKINSKISNFYGGFIYNCPKLRDLSVESDNYITYYAPYYFEQDRKNVIFISKDTKSEILDASEFDYVDLAAFQYCEYVRHIITPFPQMSVDSPSAYELDMFAGCSSLESVKFAVSENQNSEIQYGYFDMYNLANYIFQSMMIHREVKFYVSAYTYQQLLNSYGDFSEIENCIVYDGFALDYNSIECDIFAVDENGELITVNKYFTDSTDFRIKCEPGYTLSSITIGEVDLTPYAVESIVDETLYYNLHIPSEITSGIIKVSMDSQPGIAVESISHASLYVDGIKRRENSFVSGNGKHFVTVKPDEGYYADDVRANYTKLTPNEDGSYILDVDNNRLPLRIYCSHYKYVNTVKKGNGTIYLNGNKITSNYQTTYTDKATYIFIPDEGYRLAGVADYRDDYTSQVENGRLEYTPSNSTLTVTFEPVGNAYLTVTSPTSHSVRHTYPAGTCAQLKLTAPQGWKLCSASLNDEDVDIDDNGAITTHALEGENILNVVYTSDQTDIDRTECLPNINVRVSGHTVTVDGKEEADVVNIYTASGVNIYTGTENKIDVNGHDEIILIRVAGRTFKAALKF